MEQLFLLNSVVHVRFWRCLCSDALWTALLKVRTRISKDRVTDMYKLAEVKSSALVFSYKPLLQLGNSQAFPEAQAFNADPSPDSGLPSQLP